MQAWVRRIASMFLLGALLGVPVNNSMAQHRKIAVATDPTVQVTVEAMRSAQSQLVSQSSFHCTYKLRHWSQRNAQTESQPVPGEGVRIATGQFSKRQLLRRISRFYEAAAEDASGPPSVKSQGMAEIKDLPEDSLIGEFSYLSYNPEWRGGFNSVALSRFADNPSRLQSGGCAAIERQVSPLNGLAGCRRDMFCGETDEGVHIDYEIITGADEIVVTTTRRKEYGGFIGEVTCVTTLWTQPATPVLRSIEILQEKKTDSGRQELSREIVRWSDFRQCGEFLIAALTSRELRQAEGMSVFTEWSSEDLGLREPRDDDFVIRIADSTSLMGFRQGSVRPGQRALGPECLVDEAILKPNTPEAMLLDPRPQKAVAQRGTPQWFIALNVAGAMIACYLLRRRAPS